MLMRGCLSVLCVYEGDRLLIVRVDMVLCVCERSLIRVGYAERNPNSSPHIIS